jgi:hypothetical protein
LKTTESAPFLPTHTECGVLWNFGVVKPEDANQSCLWQNGSRNYLARLSQVFPGGLATITLKQIHRTQPL